MKDPKLYLYISMSLDGFIATKDDGLDWLNAVQKEGEDYGYANFTKDIQAYIVGRKTYEVVLGLCGGVFPQANQYECYILTTQEREDENGIQFYNGDLKVLVDKLKSEGKNIYCDGGGAVVKALMEKDLIDEYIISVIPTILGDGKRLFHGGLEALDIELVGSTQYDTGLVQLHYRRKK
jgi:dihydrofolate reductase